MDKLRITFSNSGDGGALRSLRHVVSAVLGEAGCDFCMTNETKEGTKQSRVKEDILEMKEGACPMYPTQYTM